MDLEKRMEKRMVYTYFKSKDDIQIYVLEYSTCKPWYEVKKVGKMEII